MHTHRHAVAVVGALLIVWLLWPAPVSAHANLVRADPPDLCTSLASPRLPSRDPRCASGSVLAAAPGAVTLHFSEAVVTVGAGIAVAAPSGAQVARGPARVVGNDLIVPIDATETGTYLVTWQVISGDTHPARGRFAFSVGAPSVRAAAPDAEIGAVSAQGLQAQVIARWLHFAGYALGFGTLAFGVLVLRPLRLAPDARAERQIGRLMTMGIAALALAEPFALLAQTGSFGADEVFDPVVLGDALASNFGRVLAQRLGAAVLLWVLVGVIRGGAPRAMWLALALGVALAGIDGEASHAISAHPVWLGLGANTVHIVAMGIWVGGLVALVALWGSPGFAAHHDALMQRFGRVVFGAFGALVVSGTIMAAQHLARPADLLTTAYGRTLAVKLCVLLAVVLLARVGLRARTGGQARPQPTEAALLLGVLVLAAALVSLPPPV